MISGLMRAMTMIRTIAAALALAALMVAPAQAAPEHAFTQWRDGDLIFQQSTGGQSAAVLAATGSRYTHMGVVRLNGGRVMVIEAAHMVGETPLARFIARGKNGRYAVYRVRDLPVIKWAVAQMYMRMMFNKPYDIFFRPGNDAFYCSELPYMAFQSAKIELGTMQRLGDLAVSSPAVAALFARRWQQHPDCKGLDQQTCWRKIQNQRLVTPASIAGDSDVRLVYSNF
jgi:hypothetical protein